MKDAQLSIRKKLISVFKKYVCYVQLKIHNHILLFGFFSYWKSFSFLRSLSFSITMACSHLRNFSAVFFFFFHDTYTSPTICLVALENRSTWTKTAYYSSNLSKVRAPHWRTSTWWSILRLVKTDFLVINTRSRFVQCICLLQKSVSAYFASICCYHNPGVWH